MTVNKFCLVNPNLEIFVMFIEKKKLKKLKFLLIISSVIRQITQHLLQEIEMGDCNFDICTLLTILFDCFVL